MNKLISILLGCLLISLAVYMYFTGGSLSFGYGQWFVDIVGGWILDNNYPILVQFLAILVYFVPFGVTLLAVVGTNRYSEDENGAWYICSYFIAAILGCALGILNYYSPTWYIIYSTIISSILLLLLGVIILLNCIIEDAHWLLPVVHLVCLCSILFCGLTIWPVIVNLKWVFYVLGGCLVIFFFIKCLGYLIQTVIFAFLGGLLSWIVCYVFFDGHESALYWLIGGIIGAVVGIIVSINDYREEKNSMTIEFWE